MLGRTPLTARGGLLLAAGIGLCVAAWPTHQAGLLWPGLFLAVLPLICWAALLLVRPTFRGVRTPRPEDPAAGDPLDVELVLTQLRATPPWPIAWTDELPPSFGGSHTFGATTPGAGRELALTYRARPMTRGVFEVSGLRSTVLDPLGLARRTTRCDARATVTVTPRIVTLGGVTPAASGRTGETPIPHLAFDGPDDVLVREYRPRDDVRRIHWPSTARTGTLMVRREEQAWDPSAQLLLDTRSVAYGTSDAARAFEWAVSIVASLGVVLLRAGYDVSITDAEGASFAAPARRQGTPERDLLRHLAGVQRSEGASLAAGVRRLGPGASTHLVIAVLGRLGLEDAHALTPVSDGQQRCWAFYLPGGDDERAATTLLRDHDWLVSATPPGADLRAAWDDLSGTGRGR